MDWLRPPQSTDLAESLRARLLWYSLLAIGSVCAVYSIVVVVAAPVLLTRLFATVPAFLVCVVLAGVARRGHIQAASTIFVLVVWTLLTGATLTGGGLHAPGQAVYFLIAFIAALLLQRWLAVSLVVGYIVGWAVLISAGREDGFATELVQHTPVTYWVTFSLFLSAMVMLVNMVSGSFQDSFAALKQAEEKNRVLLDIINSSPDLIGYADADGVLQFRNPAFQRFLGDTVPVRAAGFSEAAAQGHRRSEIVLDTLRGERALDKLVLAHRDPAGVLSHFSMVMRDITVLKQREEALERSNAELQRFASVASHDLQAPLRKLGLLSELLLEMHADQLDEDGRECLQLLVSNAAQMQQLVRDILDYARVDRAEKAPERVDARAALGAALARLEVDVAEARALVSIGPMPEAFCSPGQLEQLFQNLVGNALKYRSPDRAPQITISGQEAAAGVIFSVRDNGIGIAPRHQEEIFGLFRRLHASDAYPGSGIGLAVCARIVERHGGWIRVESELGVGSDFQFLLPHPESGAVTPATTV